MKPDSAHILEIIRYATDAGSGVPVPIGDDELLEKFVSDGLMELKPRGVSKRFATAFITGDGRKALDDYFEARQHKGTKKK